MRRMTFIAGVLMLAALAAAADTAGSLKFASPPAVAKEGGKVKIAFALSAASDVEVAVVDGQGKVVRHLAAGVLGGESRPPAPLAPGLAQSLEWDGRDDYGQPVAEPAALSVRVRAGMGVSLERIVGGDPYAFYSRDMGQGDHAAWRITGLEAKPDGSVYVMGNANNYGPPAIRQYDAMGNYRRTVFPFPAGKPVEDVKGWGVNVRGDGTYTPKYNDLSSPALSTTLICRTRGGCASLLPTPDGDKLTLRADNQLMTIGTNGTLRDYTPVAAVADPPWPKGGLFGPFFTAYSPDKTVLYVSGLFSGDLKNSPVPAVDTKGFWRDGQVWKVDLATRKASVFFALDESTVIGDMNARGSSPIGHVKSNVYAALHGVAVDADHNVLVCDRQNKRVVALDKDGKLIREIPVSHPDAIALHPASKTLYVTTRFGNYHKRAEMKLLKFNDWTKDNEPAATVTLCSSGVGLYTQNSFLAVCQNKGDVLVWAAYTMLPVRIYRDRGAQLELVKDFYEAGPQRALDLQHIAADPATEDVYVCDGFGSSFRVSDWKDPQFVRCMQDEHKPLAAVSLAIDARNRYLYAHSHMSAVMRYRMAGQHFPPAPVGESASHAVTPRICNDWRIGLGFGDRGLAVAPGGGLATLGAVQDGGADYTGYLNFFKADAAKTPWQPLYFQGFGKARSGGIRFDLGGNLYVGKYEGKPTNPPSGFETDGNFLASTGRIYKFAPTGSIESGNLFPTEPAAPAKVYDVHYGSIGPAFSRTPRFGVDGYGRIYYPTSLAPQVSVMDNEGNRILGFGTYGNRDAVGGLEGDAIPAADIPLAWPNSVDATDDYLYVSDIVNIRLLRIKKTYKLDNRASLKTAGTER